MMFEKPLDLSPIRDGEQAGMMKAGRRIRPA